MHDNNNILISAHGNSIRALCKYLFKLDENQISKLEIPTGNPLLINLDKENKITDSIKKLNSEFLRHYYSGIFLERQARSLLKHSMSRSFAYDGFIEAIAEFEIAEKMAPDHCADPILRYNSCLRTIKKENLQPRQEFDELY